MSWATQRKILYFLGFVVIVAAIAFGVFYFYTNHPATCFDGIQNQNEIGIDCGGPCTKLCSATVLMPVVLWSRLFTLAPGVYSAVAYVENPNANAQAFSVPYTFNFYNSTGLLLGSRSGTAYIPAGGQNFSIVESNITVGMASSSVDAFASSLVKTTFQFAMPINWQKILTAAADFNAIKIENQTKTFTPNTSPRVEADIANISYHDLPRIDIFAVLYDSADNAIGVSKTFIAGLPKQSSQHIVFTWITPFTVPPARVELLPVVNESSTVQ